MRLLSIIWVLLLVALSALGMFGFRIYQQNNYQTQQLEQALTTAQEKLEKVTGEVKEKTQKNASLNKENQALNSQLSSLRESNAEIQRAQEAVDKKIMELSAQKKTLENKLSQVAQSTQEKLAQQEKDFQKELASEQEKLQDQEKKLKDLLEENENKQVQLNKTKDLLNEISLVNKEMLYELQKANGLIKEIEYDPVEFKKRMEKIHKDKIVKILKKEKGSLEQAKDKLEEESLRLHYNLGLAYDQNRQFEQALAEYQKALKVAPLDADLHYNLGIIYDEHIKDKQRAIEHYQTYLKLRPTAQDSPRVTYWIEQAKRELNWNRK